MAASDRELEERLMEAGNRLLELPDSVDDLLPLLDEVLGLLERVEQSPSRSMQNALSSALKALVSKELLKHSDTDVKVSVASCISEITRITAPEAPYDDDKMKEVFQLIVSSFEELHDETSRSYNKRTSILETVAKVRSCVVMLDLECDALIIEMFQHFLKAIRDHHPENVFLSMETIMILVLEESEDISLDLLSSILDGVKNKNKEIMPIGRRLGERVLENCATKLQPYLMQAVKTLGISFDNYSPVVASVCQKLFGDVERKDFTASGEHLVDQQTKRAEASRNKVLEADENKLAGASSDEPTKVGKEDAVRSDHRKEIGPTVEKSRPVMSNGIRQLENLNILVESDALKSQEHDGEVDQSKDVAISNKNGADNVDIAKVKPELKAEQSTKKRRRKRSSTSVINSVEPSDSLHIDDKENDKVLDRRKSRNKGIHDSSHEEPSVEAVGQGEAEKEAATHPSLPKTDANVVSELPSGNLLDESCTKDESRSKKSGRRKKKESLSRQYPSSDNIPIKISEVTSNSELTGRQTKKESLSRQHPSSDNISIKVSEATSDSELKIPDHSSKRSPDEMNNAGIAPPSIDTSIKENEIPSDTDAKTAAKQSRKSIVSNDKGDGSSKKKKEDKRRGRGKAKLGKDEIKASVKDVDKEKALSKKSGTKSEEKAESHLKETPKIGKGDGQSEETPKSGFKQESTPGKEEASAQASVAKEGEDLLGLRVKVWWPKDRSFYPGKIESFDPMKKRHKVAYDDGDVEILNLKRQRWEVIESGSATDGEGCSAGQNLDSPPEMSQRKKTKASSESSAKQGKKDSNLLRGGGSSSSTKSRGKSSKSVPKASGGKSQVDAPKSDEKSRVGKDVKTKDHTPRDDANKSTDNSSVKATKSDGPGTETPSVKAKQPKPKSATKSKGKKSPLGGGSKPSNADDAAGKAKSGSPKEHENEVRKDKSPEPAKLSESLKRKSAEPSKVAESESKGSGGRGGKRRRKSVKK